MYVDDCLLIGHKEDIEEVVIAIQKTFKIKREETLSDYLSCEIVIDK